MAALTSDIVWLVEKSITLTDGSTQEVLVPQVYVRVRDGDLAPNGALLAGTHVDFKLSGDLTNSGTIAGWQVVASSLTLVAAGSSGAATTYALSITQPAATRRLG